MLFELERYTLLRLSRIWVCNNPFTKLFSAPNLFRVYCKFLCLFHLHKFQRCCTETLESMKFLWACKYQNMLSTFIWYVKNRLIKSCTFYNLQYARNATLHLSNFGSRTPALIKCHFGTNIMLEKITACYIFLHINWLLTCKVCIQNWPALFGDLFEHPWVHQRDNIRTVQFAAPWTLVHVH